MRSKIVAALDGQGKEEGSYTELQVLSSAAGFYIGTLWCDRDGRPMEPGSRDSEYFPSRSMAQQVLDVMVERNDDSMLLDRP